MNTIQPSNAHVCPWWLAYTFDNRLRRLFHKPEKLYAPDKNRFLLPTINHWALFSRPCGTHHQFTWEIR